MAYIKYNNINNNNDSIVSPLPCSIQTLPDQKFREELEHEKTASKLDSNDLQDIIDYFTSYIEIIKIYYKQGYKLPIGSCYSNNLRGRIGHNGGFNRSWSSAKITECSRGSGPDIDNKNILDTSPSH